MKFRWSLELPQPLLADRLASTLNVSPLLAQCLVNRGFSEPDRVATFLEPRLKQLADPFLLPGMSTAVERLYQALESKEPLVIFGDYDVDGVTATTLLLEVLQSLGWTAHPYLPHRLEEGYGLTQEGLQNCLERFPVKLVLAVDCGSTSHAAVSWLQARGVDTIVLDHHQISDPPPSAVALVNPLAAKATAGSQPPFHELCSAGLAFKLAHALLKTGRERNLAAAVNFDLRPLLDLVALGTIADIVPLTGENRILVTAGLQRLNETTRPGLVALKQVARSASPLGAYEVGFQLAPRLNASGRLENAEASLHLLRATETSDALSRAHALDARNRERQEIERRILDQVVTAVTHRFNPENDFVIVEGHADWHIGVVGIVAARILHQHYRPTLILGGDGAVWRGSGRSIPGFDLAAALQECSDLLQRHGGHAMAAGVTIDPANVDALRQRLNELARQGLGQKPPQPHLRLDAEIRLGELDLPALEQLSRIQPAGQGNPPLQFCVRGVAHDRPLKRIGADKTHVKMWITDGEDMREAVWWRAGELALPVARFDLAFAPQVNRYQGRDEVQLKVLDWRPEGAH